ncbi:hypothetical protein Dvina_19145 [Dactylosporangium vinaceum]|uniref:Right-handed parallel beta-helix repeat-containing protein n=1 Tax=Dactylosporangium vinaceum TaxID=53362 RepID=A0ABV5M9C3_9ACTN|nr:right-handed parallel beta-helix repeat-containing protein [Dactylosporangium vinaceum]UAB99980.1 hypothetical protein Dvina_19145 [Dactylosporangium vinaceum]
MGNQNVNRRTILTGAAVVGAGVAAAGMVLRAGEASADVGAASRPTRITVASKDAPAYIREGANYVCTGTNDQDKINAAIAEAATGDASGNSRGALNAVELSGGQFYCSGSILLRSGIDVQGAGPFATVLVAVNLTAASGAGTRVGLVKLADINVHGAGIHDLTLEGGNASGGTCDALVFTGDPDHDPTGYPDSSPDPCCYAYNLFVVNFRSAGVGGAGRSGLVAEKDSRGTFFHSSTVRKISGDAVLMDSPDSHIDRMHIGGVDGNGVHILGGNVKVTNTKAYYCNTAGFAVEGDRSTLSAVEVQDSAVGFDISASPVVISSATADSCSADGIIVRANGVNLNGFQVFVRAKGRYQDQTPMQARGVTFRNTPIELNITGRVATANIGTKVTGSVGSGSYVRITGGSSIFSAGS